MLHGKCDGPAFEAENEVAVEVEVKQALRPAADNCGGFFLCSPKRMRLNMSMSTPDNKLRLLEPCLLHSLRNLVILMLSAFSVGCAGFRGGWESVAYVGEASSIASSQSQASSTVDKPELDLPGVKLQVSIDNQLRTYDTQIIFGLPLSVDPRNVYPKNHQPGKTRVFVTVVPQTGGFVFRPLLASLVIDGRRHQAQRGLQFGAWNAQGKLAEHGGKWEHHDVGTELPLIQPGKRYLLSLEFDTPVPSPESHGIMLDLSDALTDRQNFNDFPIPPIRFTPVRWNEGYT
jgi:hypothetical protein